MRVTNDATQKHILLLKLVNLYEHAPDFGSGVIKAMSKERQWLSSVGALLKLISIQHDVQYKSSMGMLSRNKDFAIQSILGQIGDAIEELKLDLELDGRTDIGSAYKPGETYRLFADLKAIILNAKSEILIIDPYFNGEAFDNYLSSIASSISIKILADRYSKEVDIYITKHKEQYQSIIELRQSKELHDRLLIIDNQECWIIGQSIKDAAVKKATYLIPLPQEIAILKAKIYSEVWERAEVRKEIEND